MLSFPTRNYYNYEKSLSHHFGSDTFAAFPGPKPEASSTPPVVVDMAKGDHDYIQRKTVTFEDAEHNGDGTAEAETAPAKNLEFHFPVTLYAEREHFHMISGEREQISSWIREPAMG